MSGKRNKVMLFLLLSAIAGVSLLQAGSLEPPGPPAPTMVSLDSIPTSWHQNITVLRFEIVLNGEAVLDHETGLVWGKTVHSGSWTWGSAVRLCRESIVGNRGGWRLPAVEELGTLIDAGQSNPSLPPLHPFELEMNEEFWTSTSVTEFPGNAWTVSFAGNGGIAWNHEKGTILNPGDAFPFWCVRGSVGLDTGRP